MAVIEFKEVLLAIGLFVLTFVASLLVVGVLLVWIPPTFFLDHHQRDLWIDHHPIVRWTGHILKNLLGVGLIVVGVLLSVPGIPGQGLLTILIGLILLDIPGKRRLERKIVSRPRLLNMINRLRALFGNPPLVLEEQQHAGSGAGGEE